MRVFDLLHGEVVRWGPERRRLPKPDAGTTIYSIAQSGQRFLFPTPRPHADLFSNHLMVKNMSRRFRGDNGGGQ